MDYQRTEYLLIFSLLLMILGTAARPQVTEEVSVVVHIDDHVYDMSSDDFIADSQEQDVPEDSSSEESRSSRRRRSPQMPGIHERLGIIPGLPDPATIIKLVQLVQSIGDQVIPILLDSLLPASDPVSERFARNIQRINGVKRSLEHVSEEFRN